MLCDLSFLVEPFLVTSLKVHSYCCAWSSNYVYISFVNLGVCWYQELFVVNYLKLIKLALRLKCDFSFTSFANNLHWTCDSAQLVNAILNLRLHLLIILSIIWLCRLFDCVYWFHNWRLLWEFVFVFPSYQSIKHKLSWSIRELGLIRLLWLQEEAWLMSNAKSLFETDTHVFWWFGCIWLIINPKYFNVRRTKTYSMFLSSSATLTL